MSTVTTDGLREEIRAVLAEHGWTQKMLAEAMGFSEKHVSQMLTGTAGMSIGSLVWIAEAFGKRWVLADKEEES